MQIIMVSRFDRIKNYFSNAGVYLTASMVSSLLAVIINPLLAKNLSPEDYAVSTYYVSFSGLYSPLMSFFVVDYYLRRYYTYSKEKLYSLKGNVIKSLLGFSGIIGILCLVLLYAFVKGTHVSFDFMPYALLALAQTYVSLIYSFQLAEYRIAGNAKAYCRVSVFWGAILAGLSLLFVVVLKYGAVGKMLAAFLGSFFPFLWCLYKNREYLSVKFDPDTFKQFFIYGFPLVLAAMMSFFTHGYDKVLLERGGDIEMLGYYSVACSMAAYINFFATAIKSTFQPDMYKAISQRNLKKVLATAALVVLSVSIVVSIFILFCR